MKEWKLKPEQVQDFYPTPGTPSTCMFYTGIDPMSGKKVYVPSSYEEKKMQRALLQFTKPENADIIRKALVLSGRQDLIGNSNKCLVKPKNNYQKPAKSKVAFKNIKKKK